MARRNNLGVIHRAIERENELWKIVHQQLVDAFALRKPDAMARTQKLLGEAMIRADPKNEREDLFWQKDYWEPRARQLAALMEGHKEHWLYPVDHQGATPEGFTAARFRAQDSIDRLYDTGQLDDAQRKAAHRIASVVEAVTRAVGARAQSYEPRARSGPPAGDQQGSEYSDVYRPWALEQRRLQPFGERHLDLVLDLVVHGLAFGRARIRYRLGYPKAVRLLSDGLSDYAKFVEAAYAKPAGL